VKFLDRRQPSYANACDSLFDALEPRLALYAAPFFTNFPDVGEMASPQNTVVRMQTTAGIIDIELFDRAGPALSGGGNATAAPITTANFLRYIRDGAYDKTFFHRLAENFVLQGGGYTFNESATAKAVALTQYENIQNEFDPGRSNVERTIAMAKLGGNPNSATNQFFFNLSDNASNPNPITGENFGLDFQNGGFTVFGRVIGGWDIVESVAQFQTRNLNTFMNAGIEAFNVVPLSGSANTDLVTILDIDVVKPATVPDFYEYALHFPDGFRSGRTTSTVHLVNLDVNAQMHYEIVARFETGARDVVVATGALAPGAHLTVPVVRAGDPSVNKIRPGAPFALEIRATNPVAASVEHRDFGAATTQSFINPRDFSPEQLREWNFALGQKGTGVPSFLVWQNLSDQNATLTVTFTSETGSVHTLVQRVEASRRGGLNVGALPEVPAGAYSVRITSNQPIVAALSQYRAAPGRAAIETGAVDSASTQGVLPGAIVTATGESIISVALVGNSASPVVVDFEFILPGGTVHSSPALITLSNANRRVDVDLRSAHAAIPTDQNFTVRYKVRGNTAPVSATFIGLANGQTMRTAFQTISSQEVYFAGGFTNPAAAGMEFISIYNPHTDPEVTVTYRVRFHFVSGTGDAVITPAEGEGVIAGGAMTNIDVRSLALVMERINSGNQFQWYGITVSADIRKGTNEVPGAIFAQYTRLDPGGRSATFSPVLGASSEFERFNLTSPIFG
jgi:cyclophilin family peptidyl-prolyl cis-trans isomerase